MQPQIKDPHLQARKTDYDRGVRG